MKILITGANSLLGTNILVELLRRGEQVKAMVRTKSKMLLEHHQLEVCLGDITDEQTVQNAVEGCDIVIHVAADTSQSSLDYEKYRKINVKGTIHVLQAAEIEGVKRVILVSSANAFAFGTKENPGKEEGKISYPFSEACYAYSKYEAQQYVLKHLENWSFEIVVVNPTFMLGAYDAKPSSGEIILRGYKKKMIIAPPGGKNFIHVKDAAEAICNAITQGKPGHCYLLANQNMSYKDFYKKLTKTTGQKSRILVIPKFLLLLIGSLGRISISLGIPTAAHTVNMKILCVKNYYDNRKAKTDLNLKSTEISLAIKDAVDWFKKNNMIQ